MLDHRFLPLSLPLSLSVAAAGCALLLFAHPVRALPEDIANAQYEKSLSALNNSPELKAIAALEQQYFHRTFDADIPNKRMKRLELFLTGDSNIGSISDRLDVLKAYINKKRPQHTARADQTQQQAVAKLEQMILKKTNPKLDTSSRLAALEKKVFGNSFGNLSADERISRLQKTMGIGEEDIAQAPRLQNAPTMDLPPGMLMPFNTPGGLDMGMGEVFDQLNRQLRQLNKLPQHAVPFERTPFERAPVFTIPDNGFDFDQKIPGRPMLIPDGQQQRNQQGLPPYMDPNSI